MFLARLYCLTQEKLLVGVVVQLLDKMHIQRFNATQEWNGCILPWSPINLKIVRNAMFGALSPIISETLSNFHRRFRPRRR